MKDRPIVSYCLFTYNQELYVRESLEAALHQTYSPLEIIISDDCSSDHTVRILKEIINPYSGPHEIILNVNDQNLGIGAHVSKVMMELCSGDYIVMVGGDDVSFVDHVETGFASLIEFSSDPRHISRDLRTRQAPIERGINALACLECQTTNSFYLLTRHE